MTDVANLELCKELYELSGWCQYGQSEVYNGAIISYNYTLGYLLRKLREQDIFPILSAELYDRWWCRYGWLSKDGKTLTRPGKELGSADTPENATCKLAIELIKQGVLKP